MHQLLQEFVTSRDVAIRVDRTAAVIRGVKILGLASRNGRRYLPAALAQAMPLYEGAKVNVNHPKGAPHAPRDYQDRLGLIRGVELRGEQGLFGDLHFNPKHPLAEQLLWDAEHAPENVGFSHNVQARVVRRDGHDVVEAIERVQSVDLVADPATTRGLFEEHAHDGEADAAGVATAELEELRSEVARLRAADALATRQRLARRLLAEYALPAPEATDRWSRAVVSETFLAALVEAEDEPAMRRLLDDRSRLVETARLRLPSAPGATGKPTSRDQHQLDDLFAPPASAEAFAKAIRG